jgi:hypothetical protein
MTETIVVEMNGKFGPKVGGVFYSFGKFFKGEKQLPLGVPLTVDIYVSDSGKKYINRLEGNAVVTEAPPIVAPVFNNTPVAKPLAAKSETMSKQEWQDKDTRISRQGVIQIAVQVTGSFDEAVVLANKMLTYVNGK